MNNGYEDLQQHFWKLTQIDHAITFLQWDQLVMMPQGGNTSRANAIAELVTMHHEQLTAPHIKDLIDMIKQQQKSPETARSLKEIERTYNQAACLPPELVKAKSLAGSKCEHGWRTQRGQNDWHSFLINFKEVVKLAREEAQARQATDPSRLATPYDALLDLYCTGDSSELIGAIFERLKTELPVLLQRVVECQPAKKDSRKTTFPKENQHQLCRALMECLGFNFNNGRLDVSMHPFSTGDLGDQRITTRFKTTEFLEALLATAHETGHASYESGLPEQWHGLPVGQARNMCIHESQSLLFEKQLFLSKPFLRYFTDKIHKHLPQTKDLSAEEIWSMCSFVEPSLIRVEADEVTYPLHIIIRFEIEKSLVNGTLEAKDIPEIWDSKMKEYLGLSTGSNHGDGCLQDIHWTDGSFGYFPSYTMGAINCAQLFSTIQNQYPDWDEMLERGNIEFVHNWLRKNIWQIGSSLDSQDILKKATGEGTNPQYFLNHLKKRYLPID